MDWPATLFCAQRIVERFEDLRKEIINPKNPWDAMGCQVATCFEALFGVFPLGGSGVSIGGGDGFLGHDIWFPSHMGKVPRNWGSPFHLSETIRYKLTNIVHFG